MKINETLHGFTVTNVQYVNEVDATLFEMLHQKSGAKLILLDREDENATFTIGFKTVPTDDTGVFHILEHSVLCGSEKFPIKDPFTELLKGSVSTYLNALTSGDKTIYPVSSKNAKAFRGLVDVYMDAVFNPLALKSPYVFMQEGHRYELDENGDLTVSGVVYNEMQGVYSSADEYADYLITRLVSPGGTYSYDAGGNPDYITDLTYEDFIAAHDKFYHPSNAYIFLDGSIDTDEILSLIDSYLDKYDRRECDFEINDGLSPITEPSVDTYPIEEEEDPTDKTRIYLCYNAFDHKEKNKLAALSLATEAIADLNTSPLTRRILDTGLCESFSFFSTRSFKINALNAIFIGVKDGKENELISVYESALTEIINEGIPRDILASALKRREFNVRESDFGTYPAGMVYMRSCLEAAMLGESPADALRYEDTLAFLNEMLDTDYYESILGEITSSARATLILRPDPDFQAKKDDALTDKLNAIAQRMTNEERTALIEENERFRKWQDTPNTPQELNTLPTLKIDDLKTDPHEIPTDVDIIDGAAVVLHPLHTSGIAYADLYFDVSDADEDEIHFIRLFSDLLFEWSTTQGSSTDFRNKTKKHLGAFYLIPQPIKRGTEAKLYIMLHASCLDGEKDNAAQLIEEYLYSTLYDDISVVKKNAKQLYTASLEGIISRGDAYASMRSAARYSEYDAISEHLFGYEYHAFLKRLVTNTDECAKTVLARLRNIADKYFKRERLTVGITEPSGHEYAKKLVSIVRTGGCASGECRVKKLKKINEGIAVPTTVSFTALGAHLNDTSDPKFTGAYTILQSINSLEILWNEIRVKNGAYDTGFTVKPTGAIGCYSYRDPMPKESIEYFRRLSEESSDFLNTSPDLLKFIIGAFGASDTVTTPRTDGALGTRRHLSGTNHETFVRRRRECLETTLDELKRINSVLEEAITLSTYTVAGPRDILEKIEEMETILDI